MKKTLITMAIILVLTTTAFAQTIYTTKKGYLVGLTKADLKTAISFIVAKDNRALLQLMRTGRVSSLSPGIKVYVDDTSWGLWKIRPVGSMGGVWVPMEAVRR